MTLTARFSIRVRDIGDCLNVILERHGFSPRTYEEYVTFVCNGSKKLVERAAANASPQETDRMLEEYKLYYTEHCSVKTVPYDGISELLVYLSDCGCKLGICSNKPDAIAKSLAEKHFGALFDSVRGQIDGIPVKPSPESAHAVADELGVCCGECLFVGDSGEDFMTARNAGMIPVSVLWGYRSPEYLKEHGSEISASSASELKNIVEKYLKEV